MADLAQSPMQPPPDGGPGPQQPDLEQPDLGQDGGQQGPDDGQPRSPWPNLPTSQEPYVLASGRRHHSMWGQPDFILQGARRYPGVAPGPWMPQLGDVNRIVWNATKYLMQNGSVPVQQMAGLMGNSRGQYGKEFMAGRKAAQALQYEQYKESRQRLIDRQTDELKKYAGIYSVYGKDPDELGQQLTELANEFNDPELVRVLNGKGVAAAEDLLNARNNVNIDMAKVAAQSDKHEESVAKTELDRAKATHEQDLSNIYKYYGFSGADDPRLKGGGVGEPETPAAPETPDGGSTPGEGATDAAGNPAPSVGIDPGDLDQPTDAAPADPEAAPPATEASPMALPPGQAQPAPAAAPGAPAGQQQAQGDFPALPGGQQPPTRGEPAPVEDQPEAPAPVATAPAPSAPPSPPAPAGSSRSFAPPPAPSAPAVPAAAPGAPQMPDKIKEMAHSVLNGLPLPPGTLPPIRNIVNGEVAELDGQLDRVLLDPNIKGPAAVRAAVAKVDPKLAYTMDRLLSGNQAPPSNWSQRGRPWQTVLSLASKADPGFNQSTYANRAKIIASFTSGIDGRNITSIGTAYEHLIQLKRELQSRPDWYKQVLGRVRGLGPMVASPEERAAIGRIANNATTASDEYERAVIGGKPGQSTLLEGRKTLDMTNTDIDTLNGNIDNKISLLRARLLEQKARYATQAGRPGDEMLKLFDRYTSQLADAPENQDDRAAPGRVRELMQPAGGAPAAPGGRTAPGAPAESHPAPAGAVEGDRYRDKLTNRVYRIQNGQAVPE
jgi:hypothetical protein